LTGPCLSFFSAFDSHACGFSRFLGISQFLFFCAFFLCQRFSSPHRLVIRRPPTFASSQGIARYRCQNVGPADFYSSVVPLFVFFCFQLLGSPPIVLDTGRLLSSPSWFRRVTPYLPFPPSPSLLFLLPLRGIFFPPCFNKPSKGLSSPML